MSIIFAVISRGTTILAKHATCTGNFVDVAEQVLSKIKSDNEKLTLAHNSYLFHYIVEEGIVCLCITDNDFQRVKAFGFLAEIMRRFQNQYGSRVHTALPFAMNTEFSKVLASLMMHKGRNDQLETVQQDVDQLKGIMVKNIETVAQRGERLELLIDKTEDLSANAFTFKSNSRQLARKMWWKNFKMWIALSAILIIIIVVIVSLSCHTLDWSKCGK